MTAENPRATTPRPAVPTARADAVPTARSGGPALLRALVVDDEAPAREELAWLLGRDPLVGAVRTAGSAPEALRALELEPVDVVFCDIKMPGLDGLDLARVLARFAQRPQVVFVTAYDEHAVDAFDLRATDYVLKPVRAERLGEAVRRVAQAAHPTAQPQEPDAEPDDETIAVELAGVTRFVQRSQVRYVEAHGDYARLHTATSSHLVRVPLTALEERWAAAGFVRIHRSTLVALPHVDEIRVDGGRCSVRLGDRVLQVSRRHTKDLRDRLVRAASLAR
ncbi:MAG TPA: LytTR family DNA-binding domain-containing protein [Kineosporiaceae bacterium]|nr:LytTR family DNA-binding domain-containing protein [Kineosporiaceae bacterium]